MFDNFDTPPWALIQGSSHFALRDLTIYAAEHRHVIASETRRDVEERGFITIERVRVRALALLGHVSTEQIGEKYRDASLKYNNDTLRLGGEAIRIVDSDFYGSGRSLALYDPHGAYVAQNQFYNGRIGWY